MIMFGYSGKILYVNLTDNRIREKVLNENLAKGFLGGRGLGVKLLWDEVKAGIDPLSPENALIFATGPLTGTGVVSSSKFILTFKSPLTGIYAYSQAGGWLGVKLKEIGYDALVIKGSSEYPVYLYINDGEINIERANDLWGLGNFEVISELKKRHGKDSGIISIGQGGENLVRYASIATESIRGFGRCGGGAVMGSKKLKAIVVKGGKLRAKIADRTSFVKLIKMIKELMRKSSEIKRYKLAGTQNGPSVVNAWGILPTKNWRKGTFEKADNISYPLLRKKYVIKDTGCPLCSIQCTHVTKARKGVYASFLSYGPEYETLYALGANCNIGDPEPIIAADAICEDLGLDTISTGVTVSFIMECIERGLMSTDKVNGLDLKFGNAEALLKAIRIIAERKGFGNEMAEGVRRLSHIIGKGSEEFAMHSKGLELGGYDPRGVKAQGLSFAIGNRGGCHHANGLAARAILSKFPEKRFEIKGMGYLVKDLALNQIIFDSSVLCTFTRCVISLGTISQLLKAVTGLNYDEGLLLTIGERINTLERAFNVENGITREHDTLPKRILKEALPNGMAKGQRLEPEDLEAMKSEYYEAMGWDVSTGMPKLSTLKRLGLEDVISRLTVISERGNNEIKR